MKVKVTRKTSDQAHNDVDGAEIDDIRETRFIRYIIGLDLRSVERIIEKLSLTLRYYFLCQLVLSLYPLINLCLVPSLALPPSFSVTCLPPCNNLISSKQAEGAPKREPIADVTKCHQIDRDKQLTPCDTLFLDR